jgi:predicted RNase H-like nuclease (RuvC/YqgF family)
MIYMLPTIFSNSLSLSPLIQLQEIIGRISRLKDEVTRIKDDNRSLEKEVMKFTRDNMELHEECLSFMREQVEDLNLDIATTIDWRNNTMRVLNRVKKLKKDLESLSSKITE